MQTVCGIEISGNNATIVLLKGKKSEYSIVKSEFKKIKLEDDGDQKKIKSFHETLENLMDQNKVDIICIRKPSASGKFTASPTAFKIEAVLQLCSVQVELMHPTKIAAIIKKSIIPEEKYEVVHKYQRLAFEVAFCSLED